MSFWLVYCQLRKQSPRAVPLKRCCEKIRGYEVSNIYPLPYLYLQNVGEIAYTSLGPMLFSFYRERPGFFNLHSPIVRVSF